VLLLADVLVERRGPEEAIEPIVIADLGRGEHPFSHGRRVARGKAGGKGGYAAKCSGMQRGRGKSGDSKKGREA
jgi:hypothetical protein